MNICSTDQNVSELANNKTKPVRNVTNVYFNPNFKGNQRPNVHVNPLFLKSAQTQVEKQVSEVQIHKSHVQVSVKKFEPSVQSVPSASKTADLIHSNSCHIKLEKLQELVDINKFQIVQEKSANSTRICKLAVRKKSPKQSFVSMSNVKLIRRSENNSFRKSSNHPVIQSPSFKPVTLKQMRRIVSPRNFSFISKTKIIRERVHNLASDEKIVKYLPNQSIKPPKVQLVSLSKTKLVRVRKKSSGSTHIDIETLPLFTKTRKLSGQSQLISLSNTKLIRIQKKSIANMSGEAKKLQTASRKWKSVNVSPTIQVANAVVSKYKIIRTGKTNSKITRFQVDRRLDITARSKKPNRPWTYVPRKYLPLKKPRNEECKKVVCIGGMLYKSSPNRLHRYSNSSTTAKAKLPGHVIHVRGESFYMSSGGKVLKHLQYKSPSKTSVKRIDLGGVTYLQKQPGVLVRTYIRESGNLVRQAVNRSVATLAKKTQKINQYCLFYTKFGKCTRYLNDTCPFIHDSKKVAVCRKYLQGKCVDSRCLLSHEIAPEKMPTCHFFLRCECFKEDCPYSHVKVNNEADICSDFLKGFCNTGTMCKKQHIFMCPLFHKTGICSKGKKCPYPHKKTSVLPKKQIKRSNQIPKSHKEFYRSISLHNKKLTKSAPIEGRIVSNRKRYYKMNTNDESLNEKRDQILKYFNKKASSSLTNMEVDNEENKTEEPSGSQVKPCFKRMPSFIPVD